MIIDHYEHPRAPHVKLTVVTLKKGERHHWYNYWSRGPGHVIIHEDDIAGSRWAEYDYGDKFNEAMACYHNAHWLLKSSHEE